MKDFGNSLTSLAYLRAQVVDYVKISGHYVRGVADDPVYGTVVSTVNEMGRRARAAGGLAWWTDVALPSAFAVSTGRPRDNPRSSPGFER